MGGGRGDCFFVSVCIYCLLLYTRDSPPTGKAVKIHSLRTSSRPQEDRGWLWGCHSCLPIDGSSRHPIYLENSPFTLEDS